MTEGEATLVRWIVRRIRDRNLNVLIGYFGLPGNGKTYSSFRVGELVSHELGLPFGIENVHFTVRDLMHHVNQKPPRGTQLVLDDAETDANSQKWWQDAPQALALFGASGRCRGLGLHVTAPWSDMLTRQFRALFHLTLEMKYVDTRRGQVVSMTKQPYRDWDGNLGFRSFRGSMPDGRRGRIVGVRFFAPSLATGPNVTWPEYEAAKEDYLTPLYERIEQRLGTGPDAKAWHLKAIGLIRKDHPKWGVRKIGDALGISSTQVFRLLTQAGETVPEA